MPFEGIADLPPTDQSGRASSLAGKKVNAAALFGGKIGIANSKNVQKRIRAHSAVPQVIFYWSIFLINK